MKRVDYIEDLNVWRHSFRFSIPVNVRFSETDMFGHMNNVSPFIYFEEARIEFMKAAGMEMRRDGESAVPIVGDLQCDYHQQLYFDDALCVYVKAHQIGTTSIDIHYMVLNEDETICLTARGRLVFIEAATGKPVPLSPVMKQSMQSL